MKVFDTSKILLQELDQHEMDFHAAYTSLVLKLSETHQREDGWELEALHSMFGSHYEICQLIKGYFQDEDTN